MTWLHAHSWSSQLFLRLPRDKAPRSPRTGVLALSADGSKPLYSASYSGAQISNIASAIPGPDGVYLTYFDHARSGLVVLPYPQLQKGEK